MKIKFTNSFIETADAALVAFPKNRLYRDNDLLEKSLMIDNTLNPSECWTIDFNNKIYCGGNSNVYSVRHNNYPDVEAVAKVGITLTRSEIAIAMYMGATGLAPRVYDAWFVQDVGYMIVEKIKGETLYALVKKISPEDLDISELPHSLLKRLHFLLDSLGDYGVFHDDLHYEQFLIEPTGLIKIIDFGQPTCFIQPYPQHIESSAHNFFETMHQFHRDGDNWKSIWKKLQEKLLRCDKRKIIECTVLSPAKRRKNT